MPNDVTILVEVPDTVIINTLEQGPAGQNGTSGGFTQSEDNTGRTLDSDDYGKAICCKSASAQTFTLPTYAVANLGEEIMFVKLGAGKLTVQASGSDVLMDSSAGGTIYCGIAGQTYACIILRLVEANKYIGYGLVGNWATT